MILCDVGNTTYHFLIDGKDYRYLLEEELPFISEMIYYISVNDKATEKIESFYENCINLEKFLDFKTAYKGMGIDRKVACCSLKNAIIVDAGSAITVDMMKDGIHQGGFILPGIRKFEQMFEQISSTLKYEINTKVNLDRIPLCTQDAISYSILKSIILPIKDFAKDENIIFTGGDGNFLSTYFDNCTYKENLIFENMKGLIDANNCIT